jgi:UDP-3-O-[3-hydroxymyristoyl] glucosamine N-acyltransferase
LEFGAHIQKRVRIGRSTIVGRNVVVWDYVNVGPCTIIGDGARIGPGVVVDPDSRIAPGTLVGDRAMEGPLYG